MALGRCSFPFCPRLTSVLLFFALTPKNSLRTAYLSLTCSLAHVLCPLFPHLSPSVDVFDSICFVNGFIYGYSFICLFISYELWPRTPTLICANDCRKFYALSALQLNCRIRILFVISHFCNSPPFCLCQCFSCFHFCL